MTHDVQYALVWLVGSLIGYFFARIAWKKFVIREIGNDDNVFITVTALVLSWFLVVGSVSALLINLMMTSVDDTQAYWFGKRGDELTDDEEKGNRSGRI